MRTTTTYLYNQREVATTQRVAKCLLCPQMSWKKKYCCTKIAVICPKLFKFGAHFIFQFVVRLLWSWPKWVQLKYVYTRMILPLILRVIATIITALPGMMYDTAVLGTCFEVAAQGSSWKEHGKRRLAACPTPSNGLFEITKKKTRPRLAVCSLCSFHLSLQFMNRGVKQKELFTAISNLRLAIPNSYLQPENDYSTGTIRAYEY